MSEQQTAMTILPGI